MTAFTFVLEEQALRAALTEIDKRHGTAPDAKLGLLVDAELIPDGVGYECGEILVRVAEATPVEQENIS